MGFPPEVFIIGAQKSGTTSLAGLLDQHPMIVVSHPKEPDFLTVNWNRGIDWYRSCFRRHDAILVDASVGYSMASTDPRRAHDVVVPQRAHELSPNAKFIYIVRDPVDRCHSAYWHDVRAGREKRSLRDAFEQGAYYMQASFYFRQLQAFLGYFPLERFLVIRFSDFARDPNHVARRCLEFVGATPVEFEFAIGSPKNASFQYNFLGRLLRDTVGESVLTAVSSVVYKAVPRPVALRLRRTVANDIPDITSEDRAWLSKHLADDAAQFEELTKVRVLGD